MPALGERNLATAMLVEPSALAGRHARFFALHAQPHGLKGTLYIVMQVRQAGEVNFPIQQFPVISGNLCCMLHNDTTIMVND